MASSPLEFVGEIIEVLPAGKYQVHLIDVDITVIGHMSGKMKLNKITIMEGDYVKIELSEYDMSQGRIVYRFKDPQQALISSGQSSVAGSSSSIASSPSTPSPSPSLSSQSTPQVVSI